jgi:chitodextrinase
MRTGRSRAQAMSAGMCTALLMVTTSALVGPAAEAAPKAGGSAPTTPTALRVTGTTASSVSLAWNPSTDKGGVDRLRYIVVDSRGFSTLVWHPQTTVAITSLSAGSTYSFHVYAEDASWNRSGNSNTVSATLPHDTTPPTAPVLSVDAVTPSQVWLSWTRSTDDIWYGIGYQVLSGGATAANVYWLSETKAVVRHLTPSTTYSFTVRARDLAGNTSTSNPVSPTTQPSSDATAPTVPTNLRWVEDKTDCEVVIAWDQSTDDTDAQAAIEYEVFVNGDFGDLAFGGAVHTYGDRGAPTSTFTLRAVDRAGNTSAPSQPLALVVDGC